MTEISKFPLGAGHESIPTHIPKEQKARFIPSLKEITQALEKAAVQCTYAEGQMLMVTNGAEKEHCAFIRKGLWTYKSFRQGQRPNLAAIQKALCSAAGYQKEIISWQDFFHHELDILQGELHLAVT